MPRVKKRVKSEEEAVYGSEPSWKGVVAIPAKDYNLEVGYALTWYNNVVKNADKKKWLVEWAAKVGLDVDAVKAVPEDYLLTAGALARMITRGFPAQKKHVEWLTSRVLELSGKFSVATVKPAQKVAKAPSEIDPVGQKLGAVMTVFDTLIDSVVNGQKSWTIEDVTADLNGVQTKELVAHYKQSRDEMKAAYDKEDEELVEAYAVNRMTLRRLVQLHDDIIAAIEHTHNQVKAKKATVRKPRKKKFVPASKHVAKMNYMRTFPALGLTSIDPEKIVGASKLVAYNTKTRQIAIYYADDEVMGLQVKGSTLKNFKPDESTGKTVRKPEVALPEFVKAPKMRVDKIFDSIKAVGKPLTGRINNDTILIKVY